MCEPIRYAGLVHRLDRPASGVLIIAKTKKAAGRLSASFAAAHDSMQGDGDDEESDDANSDEESVEESDEKNADSPTVAATAAARAPRHNPLAPGGGSGGSALGSKRPGMSKAYLALVDTSEALPASALHLEEGSGQWLLAAMTLPTDSATRQIRVGAWPMDHSRVLCSPRRLFFAS
jgi:hypothetical protein